MMKSIRTAVVVSLAILLWSETVCAGPPAYLILRRVESPGTNYSRGHTDAVMYDARTSGYAYGFFGAAPRSHASRHFGYYRTYTQWATW